VKDDQKTIKINLKLSKNSPWKTMVTDNRGLKTKTEEFTINRLKRETGGRGRRRSHIRHHRSTVRTKNMKNRKMISLKC